MKKPVYIIGILLVFLIPLCLYAQEEDLEDLKVGLETAGKLLASIPVTHFEEADTWNSAAVQGCGGEPGCDWLRRD